MIIYNVTVAIDEGIEEDWLHWMKTKHIPQIMNCGLFIKAQINRVISTIDCNNTYAVAYTCLNMNDLEEYKINFSDDLQKKHIDRYSDKAVTFCTVMEVLEEF